MVQNLLSLKHISHPHLLNTGIRTLFCILLYVIHHICHGTASVAQVGIVPSARNLVQDANALNVQTRSTSQASIYKKSTCLSGCTLCPQCPQYSVSDYTLPSGNSSPLYLTNTMRSCSDGQLPRLKMRSVSHTCVRIIHSLMTSTTAMCSVNIATHEVCSPSTQHVNIQESVPTSRQREPS